MPDLTPENAELLAGAVKRPGVASAEAVHGMQGVETLAAMRNADQLADELESQKRINRENVRELGRLLIEKHRADYLAQVVARVEHVISELAGHMPGADGPDPEGPLYVWVDDLREALDGTDG